METVFLLQVSVSLIFFLNKLLLLVEKKSGWLVGAIAALLALIYFYIIGLYVYTVLEIGLVALMIYGFVVKTKVPRIERLINILIIVLMFALMIFSFSGMLTVYELISSATLLLGTYYLSHSRLMLGWCLYIVAHFLATIVGFSKHQLFFANFQIASVIVSMVAVYVLKNIKSR